ncbi:MAG: serine hydrolase, partial [Nocardioides sp.]
MRSTRRRAVPVAALLVSALLVGAAPGPVDADPSVPWSPIPSELGRVFADVPIGPAERVRRLPPSRQQLPDRVPWKQGASLSVEEFLTGTATRAFVVLHRGRLVEEWYGSATEPSSRLASWSVAKSLVSLLTQQAIDEGKLLMSSRVVDVLPWLRVTDPSQGDPGYNRITVRDLLDMTSGIDAPESYEADPTDPTFVTEISGLATGTYQLLVTPDLRSYARMHRQLVFT